jgi:biopolymer transport protein ExbD
MPRVKIARKSTAIDMTAMCDVAFLLLTFFILSAKPKTQDPIKAEVPFSTSVTVVPEADFSTLLISQGKVFFNVEGEDLRKKTLEIMSDKYKIGFSPDDYKAFSTIEYSGMPMKQLRGFLELPEKDRAAYPQPGVPVDTTDNNELYDWIHSARLADKYEHVKELKIGIKGDAQQQYPVVRDVKSSLQKQHVDRFNLITSLKTAK